VFLFGAVDERRGHLIIYKEIRVNNRSVEELANIFHQGCNDIPTGMMICQPLIDPKSGAKRDYDKNTLLDHYEEYGVYFKPGQVSVEARVYRLNTYIESKRITIFEDTCPGLVRELRGYKFPERTLGNRKQVMKPVDKNNHGINALEWITMELPANPSHIAGGIYNGAGALVNIRGEDQEARNYDYTPFAIRDEVQYNDEDSVISYTW
jgi:hypothetical protein